MHLFLYVRGKFSQVEEWKCFAQAAYWKWRRINPEGKEEILLVQGALRPSVLGAYEYIFPKEALVEVCSFFGLKNRPGYKFGNFRMEKIQMCALRKIFQCKAISKEILNKAEKIPVSFSTEEFERGVSNCVVPGVAVHAIGIKEDDYRLFNETGYTQEAL